MSVTVAGDERMVQASLNGPLDVHPFAAFPTDERFDDAEAGKRVERSAMGTSGDKISAEASSINLGPTWHTGWTTRYASQTGI